MITVIDRREVLATSCAVATFFLPTLAWAEGSLDISASKVFRTDVRQDRNVDNFNVALFLARGSKPGHAYVATAKWHDESGGYWGDSWIFGMYPKASAGATIQSFFSDEGVPRGKEVDVVNDKKPDLVFIVYVDNAQLARLDVVREKWRAYQYNGYSADCVSFMREAAKSIGLKMNRRLIITRPVHSLKKIIEANTPKPGGGIFLGNYPPKASGG